MFMVMDVIINSGWNNGLVYLVNLMVHGDEF